MAEREWGRDRTDPAGDRPNERAFDRGDDAEGGYGRRDGGARDWRAARPFEGGRGGAWRGEPEGRGFEPRDFGAGEEHRRATNEYGRDFGGGLYQTERGPARDDWRGRSSWSAADEWRTRAEPVGGRSSGYGGSQPGYRMGDFGSRDPRDGDVDDRHENWRDWRDGYGGHAREQELGPHERAFAGARGPWASGRPEGRRAGWGGYGRDDDRGRGRPFDPARDEGHRYGVVSGSGYGRFDEGRGGWGAPWTPSAERARPSLGRGPRNYQRSDERIREDVCDAIIRAGDVDASGVDVTVKDAEVTVSGSVTNRYDKRRIADIAEEVHGVKDVHNQIRVDATSVSTALVRPVETAAPAASPNNGTTEHPRARTNPPRA